ncbi:MAG TPA: ribbon-helix-helix protein, CopG family [Usitatibacter sp.]|nr:ribbon-helix-helix protein, CopG family [Usitatibacter sp.]
MASPTTLKLPEDLKARLAAQAEAEGKSPHAYMVEALAEKVERAERRREYLAAGAAALDEYERTGIAYAMEDVEEYFIGIAAGRKLPRPAKVARKKT